MHRTGALARSGQPYRYGLLRPTRIANAAGHNEGLLGPKTLGIEVTEPGLAGRCGLGNIDPQHGDVRDDRAAIEVCTAVPLPPPGATLVTIRPDLDAIGGMAILSLRARNASLAAEVLRRVHLTARADTFARGPWPGPEAVRLDARAGSDPFMFAGEDPELAAIAAAVADPGVQLGIRVAWAAAWLQTGTEPHGYRAEWLQNRCSFRRQLAAGAIECRLLSGGRAAVVVSNHPFAVRLGYCLAPVVIALSAAFRFQGGDPHRKFTICQWTQGHVDMSALQLQLKKREAGWGGSATVIGSPQGVDSRLSIETVETLVLASLVPD